MRPTRRQQRAEQIRLSAAALGLLFGPLLFQTHAPLVQVAGLFLCLPSALWLSFRAGNILREWQRERERETAKIHKQARQTERRARNLKARERRTQQRATTAQAEQKRINAEARRQNTLRAQTEAEALRRIERERALQKEVMRWQAMDAPLLTSELAHLLQRRGLTPLESAPHRFVGAGQIATCVSFGRRGEINDIETLEIERQEADASRAFLVALHGFSPNAVRRVRDFPAITLVETYLLAEWSLSP